MQEAPGHVTELLAQWRAGDDAAMQRLTPLLYEELRRLAANCIGSPGRSPTLQPTALVHEFYLKATALRHVDWNDRAHFVATAARVMRNIVIDNARRRQAAKRGSGRVQTLTEGDSAFHPGFPDVIAMDQALERFADSYPRHAQVVELMFFGGLNSQETAGILTANGTPLTARTVERDWRFARAWLHNCLSGHNLP